MFRSAIMAVGLLMMSCRPGPAEVAAAPATIATGVDTRSQYDFAAAVARARAPADPAFTAGTSPGPPKDPYAEIVETWSNRRYRWQLRFVPALCTRPDACRLLPFDHRRTGRWAQGWLPTLRLEPMGLRRLREVCASYDHCVVEVEGQLTVQLPPGLPPGVTFDDVRVNHARNARADESWVRRRRLASGRVE